MTKHDAYKGAYNCKNMLPATIDNNAYMLEKKSEVKARIAELRAMVVSPLIATEIERREILSEIARSTHKEPVTARERIQATDTLNKMDKLYSEGVVKNINVVFVIGRGYREENRRLLDVKRQEELPEGIHEAEKV